MGDEWQEISGKLTRLNTITQTLTRQNNQVGTSGDALQLRAELKKLRDEGQGIVKITKELLQRPYDRSQKAKHTKLQTQFTELSTSFESIAKATIKNEINRRASQIVSPSSHNNNTTTNSSSSSFSSSQNTSYNNPSSDRSANGGVVSPPLQHAVVPQDNLEHMLVDERNKEMKELESELTQISEVFVDLNKLTAEQGEQLKVAQSNTESANIRVEEGRQELEKASMYNCAYRKKMVFLIIIILIVIAIIIAVVVVEVRK